MKEFGIIDSLINYCETKNWHILVGDNWYQNYESDQKNYKAGDLVMLCPAWTMQPQYNSSHQLFQLTYTGPIALGSKFERNGTVSSLDETFLQKYRNRLACLTQEFATFAKEFQCQHDVSMSMTIRPDLNKFDTNIDFMAAIVTITHVI